MKNYAAASRYLPEDKLRTLPIACRLVPLDQWLITHVDTSWKVKDIKHWLLSKCNAWGSSNGPQPPRFRPASPVTFSTPSRRSSLDSTSWATEEGDDDDWEVFASLDETKEFPSSDSGGKDSGSQAFYHAQRPAAPVAPEHAQTSARYTLYSFSSGYILEDEADLSWYRPQPFELLELHRAGAIVPLPRASPAYLEPYFESPVLVSERPHGRRARVRAVGGGGGPNAGDDPTQHVSSHAVEWKPRWAILRSGVLHLCKEANAPPSHKFPVSALLEISGPEKLGLASKTSSRIICAKFKRSAATSRMNTDDTQERRRHRVSKTTSWVVLDMPSASAYESLLRILHRSAPHPLVSSFVSTPKKPKTPVPSPAASYPSSPISPQPSTSFSTSPLLAPFGVQYPEWRVALCARSRSAGLGDVGPAMSHYFSGPGTTTPNSELTNFFHHLPRAPSISEGLRRQAAAAHMQSSSDGPPPSTASTLGSWGDDLDDEEDVESEVEWDGWVRDLARRRELPPLPKVASSYVGENIFFAPPPSVPTSPTSSSEYGNETNEGVASTSPRLRTLSYAAQSTSSLSQIDSLRLQRSRSSTVSANTVTSHAHGQGSAYVDVPGSEISTVAMATAGSVNASPPLPYGFMSTTTTTTTITTYVERVPEPHADPHPAWHQQLRDGFGAAAGIGFGLVPAPTQAQAPRMRASLTPPSSFSRSASLVPAGSPTRGSGHTQAYVSMSVSAPGSASVGSFGSDASTSTVGTSAGGGNSTASGGSGGNSGGLGIGNVRRIVRGVSIRNAFSTDRFVRGLEDALDFVDGR